MTNDVPRSKQDQRAEHRHQNEPDPGTEIPGDTDAPDIVGRTGEEMPEVVHDGGPGHLDDHHED
jgi:hypothetical protein